MFTRSKKLPLVMRFLTVPGDILNDKLCTPPSLAIKILDETYFSQDSTLYGNYMAKMALVPIAPALIALTNKPVDISFAPIA